MTKSLSGRQESLEFSVHFSLRIPSPTHLEVTVKGRVAFGLFHCSVPYSFLTYKPQ